MRSIPRVPLPSIVAVNRTLRVMCVGDWVDDHFVGEQGLVVGVQVLEFGLDDERQSRIAEVVCGDAVVELCGACPEQKVGAPQQAGLADIVRTDEDKVLADLEFSILEATVILDLELDKRIFRYPPRPVRRPRAERSAHAIEARPDD